MSSESEHGGPEQAGATEGTGIDRSVPHSARIWNYWLGGKDNYAVDREAGDAWLENHPQMAVIAREKRAFLRRVVRFLAAEAGIDQFLDVGTGLPTAGNTHEVAQAVNPAARVVYLDNDPLVLAHARALLTSSPQGATRYLHVDMHDQPELIRGAGELLDLTRPVAVLFIGVLGHVDTTEHAHALVAGLMARMAPGSYLAIADGHDQDTAADAGLTQAEKNYAESGAVPYHNRTPAEVKSFFTGLEFVPPGYAPMAGWRPDLSDVPPVTDADPAATGYGGVARKP